MAFMRLKRTVMLMAAAALACPAQDRLQWFRNSKFGMFIHWGPYSALAGEWHGQRLAIDRQPAEWIMQFLKIPVADYREQARRFDPVRFDARRWARLAHDAGMKYLVITAKHHDGFAMYHSQVSRYNIVDWTPFKRDPLQELAAACRREGVRFCVYYSHREDWDHPDAYGNNWDYQESGKNFERYLEQKSKPQVRELLSGYGPIGLVWFDRGLYTPGQAEEFVKLVRSLQPACLINGRVGNYDQELMGDYQNMSDNGMPPGGLEEYWETPQTLNRTWGYNQFDNEWKSSRTVIRRLVEIASKGGNYLLNIGPTGDGSIPQPSLDVLRDVGEWLRRNGDSVYGTSASPFAELPWGRCTVKGQTLYLHVFDWPADGTLRLPGLRTAVKRAYLTGAPRLSLAVESKPGAVAVMLPARPTDPADTVVAVELAGRPEVDPPVVAQQGAGAVRLDYRFAQTSGHAVKRFNRAGKFHIAKWSRPEDAASWRVVLSRPGAYRVKITYAARPEWKARRYRVSLGSRSLTATVAATRGWFEYQTFEIGMLEASRPGAYVLTIRPESEAPGQLMYFESLVLE
jgi:alpha-L-fucosidase